MTLAQMLERKMAKTMFRSGGRRYAFLYRSFPIRGGGRTGSYKEVREHELAERVYTLEYVDGEVAVQYHDAIYLNSLHRVVRFPFV